MFVSLEHVLAELVRLFGLPAWVSETGTPVGAWAANLRWRAVTAFTAFGFILQSWTLELFAEREILTASGSTPTHQRQPHARVHKRVICLSCGIKHMFDSFTHVLAALVRLFRLSA